MAVLLQRQKESGLSVKSFCSNEGIAPSSFYYWKKKLRNDATSGRFIPLLVRAPGSALYPASGQRPAPGMDNTPLSQVARRRPTAVGYDLAEVAQNTEAAALSAVGDASMGLSDINLRVFARASA